ncbi:MAG: hypothetical protein PHP26_07345 [Syntrophomonas sp.]|nr:hypothetical protein [Syntrophomonas sp.]
MIINESHPGTRSTATGFFRVAKPGKQENHKPGRQLFNNNGQDIKQFL